MSKEFLLSKSPDGFTAEERLFNIGLRCTKKNSTIWGTIAIVGLSIALLGGILVGVDTDLIELASVLWVIGGLIFLIAQYGLWVYAYGLRCLEKAELLYNTRMAYECHMDPSTKKVNRKEDTKQSKSYTDNNLQTQPTPPAVSNTKPTIPESTWICKNCNTQNSINYGQCKKCGNFRS